MPEVCVLGVRSFMVRSEWGGKCVGWNCVGGNCVGGKCVGGNCVGGK